MGRGRYKKRSAAFTDDMETTTYTNSRAVRYWHDITYLHSSSSTGTGARKAFFFCYSILAQQAFFFSYSKYAFAVVCYYNLDIPRRDVSGPSNVFLTVAFAQGGFSTELCGSETIRVIVYSE